MREFRNKEFDVLISTTVVGVGIDVPDATVMIIQHAERFGLSDLHQLRGREE
jgi:ATP-dependent DNA helicase RecG